MARCVHCGDALAPGAKTCPRLERSKRGSLRAERVDDHRADLPRERLGEVARMRAASSLLLEIATKRGDAPMSCRASISAP